MDESEDPDTGQQRNNALNQELDYFDPSIDLRDLFAIFNLEFFWGMLRKVEVKLSYTMTSHAGLCTYQEQGGLCTIELSAPLLNPRPRKDLVETLLHEMIHAYLFVTRNFKDEEDHGPEFQKHMRRINEEAGMNIHIYCEFLSEMSVNQSHIWRCAGPCRDRQPYFGFVMRTVNRPPGPYDYWWHRHVKECGGNFEKIPHEEEDINEKGKCKQTVAGAKGFRTFSRSFGPEDPSDSDSSDASPDSATVDESDKGERSKSNKKNKGEPGSSNKIEGEPGTSRTRDDFQSEAGTSRTGDDFQSEPSTSQTGDDFQSEPGTSQTDDDFQSEPSTSQTGDENVRPKTRRIKKRVTKGKKRRSSHVAEPNTSAASRKRPTVSCPVCNHPFDQDVINEHVNACMEEQDFMNEISPDESSSHGQGAYLGTYFDDNESAVQASLYFYVHDEDLAGDDEPGTDKVCCPCCWKWVLERRINEHIDACLTYHTLQNNPDSP